MRTRLLVRFEEFLNNSLWLNNEKKKIIKFKEECFGGTFTQSSDYKMLPEERVRYWNGYMLFYRVANYNGLFQQSLLRNANNKLKRRQFDSTWTFNKHLFAKHLVSLMFLRNFKRRSKSTGDSLSELTELVSKGDEKGLFGTFLPPSIEQAVKSENLEFCRNRGIYDADYFQFIYNMVNIFKVKLVNLFCTILNIN